MLANQLLKAKELETELTRSIGLDPEKQEHHTLCETKIENLTKQLHDANGINEHLSKINNEKTKETTNLQQQLIDANNLVIKQQQKMSEQNFITNERLTSLNTQLFEYIDAKTGEWTEAVTSKGHNKQHNKTQQKATTKEADLITTTDNQKEIPKQSQPPPNPPPSAKSKTAMQPVSTKNTNIQPLTFKGTLHNLSNWAICDLTYRGRKFSSVEQAYFYQLLNEHREHQLAEAIMGLSNAHEIKLIGETVDISKEWLKKRASVITDIMREKFQIKKFKDELIATYPHPLHHNVSSMFWGTGAKGDGQNMTGKVLMEIRGELIRKKQPDSAAQQTRPANTKPTALLEGGPQVNRSKPEMVKTVQNEKDVSAATDRMETDGTKIGCPDVLLVGDAQLREFNPDKVGGINFVPEEAHATEEATRALQGRTILPSTIVLHLVSESLRKESVSTVTTNIKALANDLSRKHGTRVLVSLGLPVDD